MPRPFAPSAVVVTMLVAQLAAGVPTALATCGGGGGGGMGGATAGRNDAAATEAYRVPWKVVGPGTELPTDPLRMLWFPTSVAEAKASNLLSSRMLTLASARCVAMVLITPDHAEVRAKYKPADGASTMVLAGPDGAEIGRATAEPGKLKAGAAEKLLQGELDKRESAAQSTLEQAKGKLDQGDADGAAALYTGVWEERCALPDSAQKAAKALKKMGRPVAEQSSLRYERLPSLAPKVTDEIVRTMDAGLAAEREGKLLEAQRLYTAAGKIDPSDPVPVRFLGELLRHHIGDWKGSRVLFDRLLAMPSDPISRAVALHGLGKMTIHDGEFAKGLALFQQSLDAYPLALTYRNLAVYWNSERDHRKAYGYVRQAMELDPDDEYNQIFAATYLVELGKPDEARQVARRHEDVLAASYNLAAIYSQLGEKDKVLALLRRHFFVYEQFDAVRAKEMQEARDDVAFERYHGDADFIALTSIAGGDDRSYHRKPS